MEKTKTQLLPDLESFRSTLDFSSIAEDRLSVLGILIDYIQDRKTKGEKINLNFICTHNSRRSQFSQIWAKTAAAYYGIDISSFSGGVEVTAFNERAVASIKRTGFKVIQEGEGNPRYFTFYAESEEPLVVYSKIYDDVANAPTNFAAVMTCNHADQNCPYIPGARRIALKYDDPKAFDNTPQEAEKYDERSRQIATELFYVFSKVV